MTCFIMCMHRSQYGLHTFMDCVLAKQSKYGLVLIYYFDILDKTQFRNDDFIGISLGLIVVLKMTVHLD